MTGWRRLLSARSGAAAIEMAIVAPLMLAIGCGSVEVGNFMLDEHRLIKSVRDAARYAGRQPFSTYSACTAAGATISGQLATDVTNIVRTHRLSGGTDQLPNWSNAASSISVKAACATTTINSQTMSGVYSGNTNGWIVVTVAATLRYQPVIGAFGFTGRGLDLHAAEQAPVVGV
jgi:Flp pilus assembly protein TadG